ncbi:sugar phosphate isomerase/epimerase family protein [Zhongshania sp.]|uniref:sugar phosphate isomerase/epimerase family protein n=1 Tax=Zhongshania sp. TaxID=1971902 RepID=UPI00356847BB
MRRFGIHHMTAMELSPVEFVKAAAKHGCQSVSLFGFGDPNQFPLVTSKNNIELKAALRDTAIQVGNVDPFILLPNTKIEDLIPGLDIAADIGAAGISVVVLDNDQQRVSQLLGELCSRSLGFDLRVAIEFMALSPAWNSLPEAVKLVSLLNAPNLGLSVDVLHLIRSGGTAADVADLSPELFYNFQLCDSLDLRACSDYGAEAMGARLAPGEGRFPLFEILSALPSNMLIELEVPQNAGRPADERIRHVVACAKKLIATLT